MNRADAKIAEHEVSSMKRIKKLSILSQTLRVLGTEISQVRGGVIWHSENDLCPPSAFGTCDSCPSHDIGRCGTGQD